MAIENTFYMDAPASRQQLRNVLVNAGIGLQADEDLRATSGAYSDATGVVLSDDLSGTHYRPNNGISAKCRITFRDRRAYLSRPDSDYHFEKQTILAVVALLKAYPQADAYWTTLDAEIPTLIRRDGHLTLASNYEGMWTEANRKLVNLPHTLEPLGPW